MYFNITMQWYDWSIVWVLNSAGSVHCISKMNLIPPRVASLKFSFVQDMISSKKWTWHGDLFPKLLYVVAIFIAWMTEAIVARHWTYCGRSDQRKSCSTNMHYGFRCSIIFLNVKICSKRLLLLSAHSSNSSKYLCIFNLKLT